MYPIGGNHIQHGIHSSTQFASGQLSGRPQSLECPLVQCDISKLFIPVRCPMVEPDSADRRQE